MQIASNADMLCTTGSLDVALASAQGDALGVTLLQSHNSSIDDKKT